MLTPDQIKDKIEDKNFKDPMHAYDGYEVVVPKDKLAALYACRESTDTLTRVVSEVMITDLRPEVEEYLKGQGKFNHQLIQKRNELYSFMFASRAARHIKPTTEYDHAIFRFARSSTAITFKLAYL